MSHTSRSVLIRLGLVAVLAASLGSCAAAVGAAAGAAGAIAYTRRGAETSLDANVEEVIEATEAVFSEMGIEMARRELEEDGTRARLEGMQGDTEVAVSIELDDGGLAHVEVTARENMVEYDPDHAEEILRAIVERA